MTIPPAPTKQNSCTALPFFSPSSRDCGSIVFSLGQFYLQPGDTCDLGILQNVLCYLQTSSTAEIVWFRKVDKRGESVTFNVLRYTLIHWPLLLFILLFWFSFHFLPPFRKQTWLTNHYGAQMQLIFSLENPPPSISCLGLKSWHSSYVAKVKGGTSFLFRKQKKSSLLPWRYQITYMSGRVSAQC